MEKNMSKIDSSIKIKNVRCSYAHFFEPRSVGEGDNAKMKFGTALIIPYDHPQAETIKDIADALGEAKFGQKWATVKRNRPPLRDPWREYKKACKDAEEEGDDPAEIEKPAEYLKGSYVLNVNSDRKPQVVDQKVQPIFEEAELYSGCYINISCRGFAYDKDSNRGVAFGMNNVQLVKQGERLGGAPNAEEEFDEIKSAEDEDFELT